MNLTLVGFLSLQNSLIGTSPAGSFNAIAFALLSRFRRRSSSRSQTQTKLVVVQLVVAGFISTGTCPDTGEQLTGTGHAHISLVWSGRPMPAWTVGIGSARMS